MSIEFGKRRKSKPGQRALAEKEEVLQREESIWKREKTAWEESIIPSRRFSQFYHFCYFCHLFIYYNCLILFELINGILYEEKDSL